MHGNSIDLQILGSKLNSTNYIRKKEWSHGNDHRALKLAKGNGVDNYD